MPALLRDGFLHASVMNDENRLATIVDGVFGRRCVFCGFSTASHQPICAGCYADLPWRIHSLDPSPGRFEQLIVPLRYAFPIDAAIKAFKFRRKLFYAPAFATILLDALESSSSTIDAVLPVPLHWRRRLLRGFNQARELACPIAKALACPIINSARRRVATVYQSGLSRQQRRRNVSAVFSLRGEIHFGHVLIVDDIVTTGATLVALRKLLQKNGVKQVSAIALARTDV